MYSNMIIHAFSLKWKINKFTNQYWILKNKRYVTFLFGSTSLNFAIFQKLQVHYSLLRKAQYFRIPGAAVEKGHYWQQKLRQMKTYGNICSCSHMCTHSSASLVTLLLCTCLFFAVSGPHICPWYALASLYMLPSQHICSPFWLKANHVSWRCHVIRYLSFSRYSHRVCA